MLELAKRNAEKMGAINTQFVLAKIDNLPLPDNSVDCVMSNCVLNLVPDEDKLSVVKEMHRILKPCGRFAICDFLALKPLSEEIKQDEALRTGCVAGAIEVESMKEFLFDIGFDGKYILFNRRRIAIADICLPDVLLVNHEKDINLYKDGETAKVVSPCCAGGSCGPKMTDLDLNEWICKSHKTSQLTKHADRFAAAFQMYGPKWCGKTEQHSPIVTSLSRCTPLEKRQIQAQACTNAGC